MTKEFYTTENYETDYSTFGGVIYSGDFDSYHSMADIAKRIESDFKFDKRCRKNVEGRDRNKNYKKGE